MIRSVRGPLAAVALALASGCMVVAHPAGPAIMPAGQAVSIAAGYARSRGLLVDYTLSARLDRRARWHIELGGAGGRDHGIVVVDGYSGAVLRARLQGPRGLYAPAPAPAPAPSQGPPQQAPAPPPPAAPPPPPPGAPPPPPAEGPPAAPGSPGPTPAPPAG